MLLFVSSYLKTQIITEKNVWNHFIIYHGKRSKWAGLCPSQLRVVRSAVSGVHRPYVHKYSACRKSAIHLNNSSFRTISKELYQLADWKISTLPSLRSSSRNFPVSLRWSSFSWIWIRLFKLMRRFSHALHIWAIRRLPPAPTIATHCTVLRHRPAHLDRFPW